MSKDQPNKDDGINPLDKQRAEKFSRVYLLLLLLLISILFFNLIKLFFSNYSAGCSFHRSVLSAL